MLGKVIGYTTLGAFVLLSALMQSTSPSTIHPVGILLVFVLLYLLALGVLTFFIFGLGRVIASTAMHKNTSQIISFQHAYYYASVLALGPVMILGMRSIGRADVYDVLLVLLFEIIACFYITKRR